MELKPKRSCSRMIVMMGLSLGLLSFANAGEVLHFKNGQITYTQKEDLWAEATSQQRYFVVQFRQKITAEDKRNLTSKGLDILRYVPEDALLVRGDFFQTKDLSQNSKKIQQIVPYLARFKWDKSFPAVSVFNAEKMARVLVTAFPGEGKSLENILKKTLQEGNYWRDGRFFQIEGKLGTLFALSERQEVEWMEVAPELQLQYADLADGVAKTEAVETPEYTGYESGTKVMNFDMAWELGWTGAGQVASSADTGVSSGELATLHRDLGVSHGYAFGFFTRTWKDPMGHGTHVAGSVLGNGELSGGRIRGGAYEATLVAEGMWSDMLNNISVPPRLSKLFEPAYKDGARIHTNSWGSPQNLGAYSSMSAQVDEFMWNQPDMLIIFAAGNSGKDENRDGRIDPGSVSMPGTAKNTLTVGASENLLAEGGIQRPLGDLRGGDVNWGVEPLKSDTLSDNPRGIAGFSSRGPTNDGRLKPELVAPGTNIVSARSHESGASPLWGIYDENYVYSGGTSMATPLAAGAAVVVRQYLQEKHGLTSPSAALIKAVLMQSSTDLFPGQYGEVGARNGQELLAPRPDNNQGFGRVDMAQAVFYDANDLLVDERGGVATGEEMTYNVKVEEPSALQVTLVYTDFPGALSSSQALVNNLNVTISGPGVSEELKRNKDNFEHIDLKSVEPGEYTITVKGEYVPMGGAGDKLGYSLLVNQSPLE